jgi:hypothetical protein
MNIIIAIMKYLITNEPNTILLNELKDFDKANFAVIRPATKLSIDNIKADTIEISILVILFL